MNRKDAGEMKRVWNRIIIDGIGGMSIGVFSTWILGTMIAETAVYIPGTIGSYMVMVANVLKTLTGAGIGVAMAVKIGAGSLLALSGGLVGMIGAFPLLSSPIAYGKPGDMLCAFVCAFLALNIGGLVCGRTKADIFLTPIVTVGCGAVLAFFIGPYSLRFTKYLGHLVTMGMEQKPILMSIIVGVLMGMLLTFPVNSGWIAAVFHVGGLAGGAAVIGGCCQMVGFAVMSFRENGVTGLFSQGIGTSMLQMPNIIRKPTIWLPPIIASALLAPVGTVLLEMKCNASGAGMGSCAFIGQIASYHAMVGQNGIALTLLKIFGMHLLMPAIVTMLVGEGMRRMNLIKSGDMTIRW